MSDSTLLNKSSIHCKEPLKIFYIYNSILFRTICCMALLVTRGYYHLKQLSHVRVTFVLFDLCFHAFLDVQSLDSFFNQKSKLIFHDQKLLGYIIEIYRSDDFITLIFDLFDRLSFSILTLLYLSLSFLLDNGFQEPINV